MNISSIKNPIAKTVVFIELHVRAQQRTPERRQQVSAKGSTSILNSTISLQKKKSSVNDHSKECPQGRIKEDYRVHFLENVHSRGKYTLSEREFLWNERLGGEINIQKILRNN